MSTYLERNPTHIPKQREDEMSLANDEEGDELEKSDEDVVVEDLSW